MDKNYLVTKSNYFIMNSSYDLSLEEQKLILTLASMVQPEDEDFKPYIFKISEFIDLLGIETQTKYTEVPKITKDLMKKVFEIRQENKITQVAWLSSAEYEKGSGIVELEFSPKLKPYMLKLNSMFTQYKLANILNMKSKYSPRIYELLKCNEFKKQGYIEIEVDDLRKILKADNIYHLYADFKRKIILQTQKELKKLSDISFDFEEIKTGRKVTTLRFYIHSNKEKLINEKAAIDELSATAIDKEEMNIETGTREVLNILKDYKIDPINALKIYQNANGDINYIEKVYQYSKTQNVSNLIGFMKTMVVPGVLQESIRASKELSFNNFEQRAYDGSNGSMTFDELEQRLLGWESD